MIQNNVRTNSPQAYPLEYRINIPYEYSFLRDMQKACMARPQREALSQKLSRKGSERSRGYDERGFEKMIKARPDDGKT